MSKVKNIFLIIFSTIITGLGVGIFLTPNKIVSGGGAGVATILFHTLSIPPGATIFFLNVILLLPSIFVLGKSFVIKTLMCSFLMSLFVQLSSYFPFYTNNTTLSTIFGGVIYGTGVGLNFVANATTGGTAILARLIQHRFPSLTAGKILLVLDGIIILSAFAVFRNLELALLGILALVIATWAVDFVIAQLNTSKIVFVISAKGDEISQKLVSSSHRGVTVIDAMGAYTSSQKKMLFCALKENEIAEFMQKVLTIDPEAFVVFTKSYKIQGNGFYIYK